MVSALHVGIETRAMGSLKKIPKLPTLHLGRSFEIMHDGWFFSRERFPLV